MKHLFRRTERSFPMPSIQWVIFLPFLVDHAWTVKAQDSLDICINDLLTADANTTDGFLSLYEYEVFVNKRYYAECEEDIIVAESISQWEAFTVLACYSCLNDFEFIDAIPDCCLPFNNSRIDILSAASFENDTQWLTRICNTADAAAVVDECYTAVPTLSPISIDEPLGNGNSTGLCDDDIKNVDVENNKTDGYLSRIEFRNLLSRMENQSCTVTNESKWIDAVYANLACASCYLTSSNNGTKLPDLSCCSAANASISIADAVYVLPEQRSVMQTDWLQRICTTVSSILMCNFTNDVNDTSTVAPIATQSNDTETNQPSMAPNNANDTAIGNRTTMNPLAVPIAAPAISPVDNGANSAPVAPPDANAAPTLDIPTSGGTAAIFPTISRNSIGPLLLMSFYWFGLIFGI